MKMIIMTRTPIIMGGYKKPKHKVKFPCKICGDDHLTHLFPQIEDASKFIAQSPIVLTNPLSQNQNMNSRTMDPRSASDGSQNPPNTISVHGCINMMFAENVVTRAKDYGTSQPELWTRTCSTQNIFAY